MEKRERNKLIYGAVFPAIGVILLWVIKVIEVQFDLSFVTYGILPRTISGLKGVALAPLVHGDWNHLINNSIPLFLLGWAIFYFYKDVAPKLILWSYLLAGFYTWISARMSYHIGASGLVYALFGFLFISGFIRKHMQLIALSFLTAFLYGSLVWGILPWDKSISWEGHFWGLFVGLVLAYFYRKQGPQRKEFEWPDEEEEEPFGEEVEFEEILDEPTAKKTEVVYHFVPTKKKEEE